jgi:hypothetical protein
VDGKKTSNVWIFCVGGAIFWGGFFWVVFIIGGVSD